jgi:hypothetical protein
MFWMQSKGGVWRKNARIAVKNAGYHKLLKIAEVFDGESPIDQCIEYFTLTDTRNFKMKCGSLCPCDVELKMYLRNIQECW